MKKWHTTVWPRIFLMAGCCLHLITQHTKTNYFENSNAFLIIFFLFVCFSFNANPKHDVLWYCCNLCIVNVGFGRWHKLSQVINNNEFLLLLGGTDSPQGWPCKRKFDFNGSVIFKRRQLHQKLQGSLWLIIFNEVLLYEEGIIVMDQISMFLPPLKWLDSVIAVIILLNILKHCQDGIWLAMWVSSRHVMLFEILVPVMWKMYSVITAWITIQLVLGTLICQYGHWPKKLIAVFVGFYSICMLENL